MSIYEQQREQIKKLIIDTAVHLYKEKGYEATKIEEITQAVGIAKGTFYNFFKSKLDILLVWAEEEFSSLDVAKALNSSKTARVNLKTLISMISLKILSEKQLFLTFLTEILKLQNKGYGHFPMDELIKTVMMNSKDYEIIKEQMDLKVNILTNSLFLEIIHYLKKNGNMKKLESHLFQVTDICFNGFLKSKKE